MCLSREYIFFLLFYIYYLFNGVYNYLGTRVIAFLRQNINRAYLFWRFKPNASSRTPLKRKRVSVKRISWVRPKNSYALAITRALNHKDNCNIFLNTNRGSGTPNFGCLHFKCLHFRQKEFFFFYQSLWLAKS